MFNFVSVTLGSATTECLIWKWGQIWEFCPTWQHDALIKIITLKVHSYMPNFTLIVEGVLRSPKNFDLVNCSLLPVNNWHEIWHKSAHHGFTVTFQIPHSWWRSSTYPSSVKYTKQCTSQGEIWHRIIQFGIVHSCMPNFSFINEDHWSDLHENLFSRWCSWRNHVCQISNEIFRGYDFTGGWIFHFPIDFWMGLTTVQHYCTACDMGIETTKFSTGRICSFLPHMGNIMHWSRENLAGRAHPRCSFACKIPPLSLNECGMEAHKI